jgi:hypothetical protein
VVITFFEEETDRSWAICLMNSPGRCRAANRSRRLPAIPSSRRSPGLVYSTYLSAYEDNLLAVGGAGNANVTGNTASLGFPTTAEAFQRTRRTNKYKGRVVDVAFLTFQLSLARAIDQPERLRVSAALT